MRTSLCVSLVAIGLGMAAGCVKVDAKAPSFDKSPPPATVTSAVDDDKADLLRENRQLRGRIAWLEKENRKLADKARDREEDVDDLFWEIEQLEADCERFRSAMER